MANWMLVNILSFMLLFLDYGAAFCYEDIILSETFGEGTKGIAFSDISGVKLGQMLSSVTVRGDERVDQVTVRVASPDEPTWTHGGSGGTDNILILSEGEYVNSMEIHVAKKLGPKRVFYLRLYTNTGNSVGAGSKTDESATVDAPEGYQFSGFFGRAGTEVYELGAIWTRINASHLYLTDDMGSEWYGKKIRNWVGPTVGDALDSACYRKSEPFSSSQLCPLGYNKTDTNCIAQCPLSYPIKCGLECIPQNDNCILEILQKTASVVSVVFNTATVGVFGEVKAAYKKAHQTYMCAASIIGVLKSLIYYLRFQQTTAPQGSVEELLAVAYQTDVVVVDLPIAVCTCLGLPVSFSARVTGAVIAVVENIVKQAIVNGDQILSSATDVMTFLRNVSALNSPDESTLVEIQDFLDSNTTCGFQLKSLTDRISTAIESIRNVTPSATSEDIRVTISRSSLVLTDVASVTNNCMGEILGNKTTEASFQTRDLLRKTMGIIIDQLIETNATDMGVSVAKDEATLESANLGLVVLSGLDPTGILWMVSQFVQPTCGPTSFIGEIDDGTLFDALGLTTVDEAFEGSYGAWTKEGDGMVNILFKSIDTKDVNVVIHSGGSKYAEVKVASGETVTWNASIAELQDKTLYLDRWRPNFIGIPGSGGGSLVLWVPRSSKGGHLALNVRINAS
ncbi:hypothetical protein F441_07815 [Phytophthora nicotianae CJ01A1]|uniref:Jacalin-type lectin domain-containing protein n=2 Tax=Phytophthora nicotianae TaxID=4792 RepID=W2J6N6_PHYNI|nr:hypothetical protein L915_07677 [Phytophthora nicotianae]ETL41412.1 hypothetical protein L916_07607 [Phytophthora nicotianae]ETP17867.1 hypothetical protein F441_07815 [Phytophthora nicotianae CJ01A1]